MEESVRAITVIEPKSLNRISGKVYYDNNSYELCNAPVGISGQFFGSHGLALKKFYETVLEDCKLPDNCSISDVFKVMAKESNYIAVQEQGICIFYFTNIDEVQLNILKSDKFRQYYANKEIGYCEFIENNGKFSYEYSDDPFTYDDFLAFIEKRFGSQGVKL